MHLLSRQKYNNAGLSLVELIVTLTILGILAALVLPSAQMTAKRTKEIELRRNLRTIRTAIDDFKRTYDKGISDGKPPVLGKSGYPESLDILVEGFDFGTAAGKPGDTNKKKFLRRIPVDPFNPSKSGEPPEWGLRSYVDQPDSMTWGGEDVFDVYSKSEQTAIDGTKYNTW